jgi:hypothetical protein
MAKNRKGSSKHGVGSTTVLTSSTAASESAGVNASLRQQIPFQQHPSTAQSDDSAEHPTVGGSPAAHEQRPLNSNSSLNVPRPRTSLYVWFFVQKRGLYWLCFFMIFGFLCGLLAGSISGGRNDVYQLNDSWYHELYRSFHFDGGYQFVSQLRQSIFSHMRHAAELCTNVHREYPIKNYFDDPTNTRSFSILREAIVREAGGYVHPDLGILFPAPCGAFRGIGMIRSNYYRCQRQCFPSTEEEKRKLEIFRATGNFSENIPQSTGGTEDYLQNSSSFFLQEEILIRVPLKFQITRNVALKMLQKLIPEDVQHHANMQALDDALLIALFLAHERGVGEYSHWAPYLLSLPVEPTCGYSRRLRPLMLNAIEAYHNEIGVDTNGWAEELYKAMLYSDRITEFLNTSFGAYIKTPRGLNTIDNLSWSLCQVSSRATAGSPRHGSLRLIPMIDLINHDVEAGSFFELSGTERIDRGDFLNAFSETDSGTIVVRSVRHGRIRPLRHGQELLVNYNVPYYTPLDWFVSLGFVPRERWEPWFKMDAVLPQVRRDGPFAFVHDDLEDYAKHREEQLLKHLKDADVAL